MTINDPLGVKRRFESVNEAEKLVRQYYPEAFLLPVYGCKTFVVAWRGIYLTDPRITDEMAWLQAADSITDALKHLEIRAKCVTELEAIKSANNEQHP